MSSPHAILYDGTRLKTCLFHLVTHPAFVEASVFVQHALCEWHTNSNERMAVQVNQAITKRIKLAIGLFEIK